MLEQKGTFIEAIYIFDDSGLCLVSSSLKSDETDDSLLTGFFNAIRHFGREEIGCDIECLVMSGRKLFYNDRENITFAIQSSTEIPTPVVQYILNEISNQFLRSYGTVLPTWKGDLSAFADFELFLSSFLESSIIEKILDEFGYTFQAEGMILFDERQDAILFAKLPEEYSSRRQKSLGGMLINFAKTFSEEFKGGTVNSILISAEKKWICVAKREHVYITVLFPKTKDIELDIIVEKTEETLTQILNVLWI
jgi:hypothetical protein